jgi:CelD/BcsL family acetyltransferase involved in cellulose biosynthesis
MQCFSGKTRKKMRSELNRLTAGGVSYRYDCLDDVAHLFRMNLEYFKGTSYFEDVRFLRAFENLVAWLHANNMLRVTTVLIGGRLAAVDIGAVWNQTYTVLAGGTHPEFPGVAKLINFHHIEWACQQRLKEVDFLCGEFNWKHRFHLSTRPLYRIEPHPLAAVDWSEALEDLQVACAV